MTRHSGSAGSQVATTATCAWFRVGRQIRCLGRMAPGVPIHPCGKPSVTRYMTSSSRTALQQNLLHGFASQHAVATPRRCSSDQPTRPLADESIAKMRPERFAAAAPLAPHVVTTHAWPEKSGFGAERMNSKGLGGDDGRCRFWTVIERFGRHHSHRPEERRRRGSHRATAVANALGQKFAIADAGARPSEAAPPISRVAIGPWVSVLESTRAYADRARHCSRSRGSCG
jgi:hypothetical protein